MHERFSPVNICSGRYFSFYITLLIQMYVHCSAFVGVSTCA